MVGGGCGLHFRDKASQVAPPNLPLCPCPAGWLLNLKHLTLGDRIGQGEFGGR